jgi:hypothetical protein
VRDLMIEILRENGPPRRALERAIETLGRRSPSTIRGGPTTATS